MVPAMTDATTPLTRRSLLAGTGIAATGLALPGLPARASTGAAARRAARVIVGGHVFTGTRQRGAEAVAIGADGRIIAVGSNREIRSLVDGRTEVLHADGATIMPGIHDGHMHALPAAEQAMNPSLHNASLTVADLQATLQGFLDASSDKEPDGWLQVTDWSPVGLLPTGTVADKSMLDALTTSRPIYLQGSDFHNSWVNSRALALAGIDRNTPDPAGGEIVRDVNGDPTGLLKDQAQWLVAGFIPPPSDAELEAGYTDAFAYLLSQGITSIMDAASGEDSLVWYERLIGSGKVLQQVTPALVVANELTKRPRHALEWLHGLRKQYGDVPGMHVGTAKVFVDGVMEYPAQTAALLEPYLDENGKPTKNRGDLYLTSEEYQRLAVVLDKAGWQLHSHAIGDRAVRVALDAYEAANAANGRKARAHRHTIAHLELVHPDDYPRFARTGTLASMQLQWAVRNIWTLGALRPFVGEERFHRLYPSGSLERAGARLVGGSDWPVDPLSPFNQIATAIDRTAEPTGPLLPGQALSRTSSLAMHTRGSAFQLHEGNRGVIAPGKVADLVVTDRDLLTSGPSAIRSAAVQLTLVGGKVAYDAATATGRRTARRGAAYASAKTVATRHACCSGHS